MIDADFVVIGSGPAGVSAAIPLVRAGRKVLMIDGANGHTPALTSQPTSPAAPWRHMFGENLEALVLDENQSPKLSTPAARRIVEPYLRKTAITASDFLAVGAIARGGLSSIWGGFAVEYDADDLRGWPISPADLQPFYRRVTERIGVSGSSGDDLCDFYGQSSELEPPLRIGRTAERIFARYCARGRTDRFAMGRARNAIITKDRPNRAACDLRRDCLWGCARGAIYDSRFDLIELARHPNFQLLDDALAVRVHRAERTWNVLTADGRAVMAPTILLAAGCLATTKLAIGALERPPKEIRVLSSPVLALPFLVPSRLGAPAATDGYSLAQLGYRYGFAQQAGAYVTGGIYEIDGLPTWSFTARLPLSKRGGMQLFPLLTSALGIATCYFSGEFSDNSVRWVEANGRISLTVRGGFAPALSRILGAVRRGLGREFRRIGAWMLPGAALAGPGTDVHYGGTLPMGLPDVAGTDRWGELNGAPGLFVVDGASLPSVAPKYPTLTIMANAGRIGQHLADLGSP